MVLSMQIPERQTPVCPSTETQSSSQEQVLPGAARAPVVEDGSPEDDGLVGVVSSEDDGVVEDVSPVADSSSPQAVKPMKTRKQE